MVGGTTPTAVSSVSSVSSAQSVDESVKQSVAGLTPETFVKYDPPIPPGLRWYATAQFVAALAGSLALLEAAQRLAPAELLAGVFYVTVSLGGGGGGAGGGSWGGG